MPIAIWEEDFTRVKKYLDSLKQQGVTDFRTYFAIHSDAVLECAGTIRILNVNNAAVQMFQAGSREQLIENADQGLSQGEIEHIHEVLIDIAEGRTGSTWEGADETLTGKPIEISLSWSIAPDNQDDYFKFNRDDTILPSAKGSKQNYRPVSPVIVSPRRQQKMLFGNGILMATGLYGLKTRNLCSDIHRRTLVHLRVGGMNIFIPKIMNVSLRN